MKMMMIIIGLLTVLAGVLPFLKGFGILPAGVPTSGVFYSGLIIIIGVIGLLYGIRPHILIFKDKFIVSALGILIIFGGVLPFLTEINVIPKLIPASGPLYPGIITFIGIITICYGYNIAKRYA